LDQTKIDSKKTRLLKLRHGQYMGNAKKQLFFGREAFPSITCFICNSPVPNTWLHVLLKCKQHHILALQTKRHNKAIWESRCYVLMNVGTFNNDPCKNIVPSPIAITLHVRSTKMSLQCQIQTIPFMYERTTISISITNRT
jgi:hypothetical protein